VEVLERYMSTHDLMLVSFLFSRKWIMYFMLYFSWSISRTIGNGKDTMTLKDVIHNLTLGTPRICHGHMSKRLIFELWKWNYREGRNDFF
jgi:hypothetical protein